MRSNPNSRPDYEASGSLIAFTTLAPLSVGGLLGLLVCRIPQAILSIDQSAVIVFAVGFLALLFSLFHLGRPWKAPLAILHLSTSWLSREVLLFSFFLTLLFCYAVLPIFNIPSAVITAIGGIGLIFGLLSTLATGKTYHLKARPAWDHWSTIYSFLLEALTAGVLFGIFTAHLFVSVIEVSNLIKIFLTILIALVIVTSCLRYLSANQRDPEALSSRAMVIGPYLWLFVARLTLGFIAIVMLWIPGEALYYAWMPALVGETMDRILFFSSVVPVTLVGRYT
jgi:anaerobic dimethyl sulfoxide reductase subunit C (anchor subunit)